MYVTWQTVITAGAVVTAVIAIGAVALKVVRWIDRQKEQDKEIANIKEEQQLVVYGILACLKGLSEQGCDGPVHAAIDKIEKHINKKAHE